MTYSLFILKKIVSAIFMPLSIVALLLIAGLFFLGIKKRQHIGKRLLFIGTALLLAMSYGFLTDYLASPLEDRHPPVQDVKKIINHQDIKWIIVLGGGSYNDPRLPLSSRLTAESLSRVLEGIRLYRQLPGTKLLVSGGAVFQEVPEGEVMARTALLMGAGENDIVQENKSLDTHDQAKEIAALVGKAPFLLVTSAIHMPRSVALFRKYGLNPIPAPTNYLVIERTHLHPGAFFPGATALRKAEASLHEYLGLIWSRVQ